ncbi:B-cell receptor CD22-like [Sander lucioperca]|uniref:B-cell receptor CD22-like n=1 Tax=Sander lucioperca TaxID=283035 RepID=UPI001653D0CA|nr:B-cell receptor CD22-like [Sander lucioperca]
MSLTAAASGFVVFLLSVQVIQGQDDWGVTSTSTQICAVKGSTVNIHCSYTYPSWWKGSVTTVERTLWFTKMNYYQPVDLTTDSEYSGRVQHSSNDKDCTLRISDLRERDSAEYKFMFTTNQEGGRYITSPGVTLSVTALQVQVIRVYQSQTYVDLKCHSSCSPAGRLSYVWFNNREHITSVETSTYRTWFNLTDLFSCALKGHEKFPSPSVYAPKLPSVSVRPSAEIMEGSSVTLTCSSDANPAANYTWYKENQTLPHGQQGIYHFTSISSEDRGNYYCKSENQHGHINSTSLFIDVQYGPKLPSVSVSPSAEIVEGSSVNLTCSSDANPAAKYTWYKKNQTLL